MTNWGNESNDDGLGMTNESNGPKALRDAYEALKQQNKDLQDGFAAIQADLKKQKVSTTLNELGVPAEAAALYQGDADPDKVKEWATTMKTVFGGGATSTPSIDVPQATITGDAASQFQSMTEAGQAGTPLGNAEAAYGRVNDATDIDGLLQAWSTMRQ